MVARPVIEIGTLATMLGERIEGLVRELLPRGHREGHDWVEARRADGGLGDGLRVCLTGTKRGVWAHFGDGPAARGDALDLVAWVLFAGDKREAIGWAKGWLGLAHADPKALARARETAAAARRNAEEKAMQERETRARRAQAMWLNAHPLVCGDPAWTYLVGRRCDPARLAKVPGSLRFAPRLWNGERGDDALPALVAAIYGPRGFCAIHRTWLEPDSDSPRSWIKAGLKNPKMTYGEYAGGAIRLTRGAAGTPLAQAKAGELVCLTEGIEDGICVAIAVPEARVLVAVSLANMARVALPDAVTEITLCADNDGSNSRAAAALDTAIRAHRAAGRRVRVARPPDGYKDFNEFIQRAG